MRLVSSDAAFEADVGLAAGLGMPARAPKHVGSASLLHEVALSARARTFGAEAEEVQRSAGLVSRVARRARFAGGGRARCRGSFRRVPLPLCGFSTKWFIAHMPVRCIGDI